MVTHRNNTLFGRISLYDLKYKIILQCHIEGHVKMFNINWINDNLE